MTCSGDLNERTSLLIAADWCAENDHPKEEAALRMIATWKARGYFIGSRRYGTPRPNSDFDWVFVHGGTVDFGSGSVGNENDVCDRYTISDDQPIRQTLKFGCLCLMLITESWVEKAIRESLTVLMARSPVTREDAITTIDEAMLCNKPLSVPILDDWDSS